MPDMTYIKSLQQSAAIIFQADFAVLPAIPMSPHAHVLGPFTAEPAQPLSGALREFCDAALDTGMVYVSTGSSAIPGAACIANLLLLGARPDF